MVKLDVLNLLEENGKTKYWLYKRLGMSYQNFNKMVNNETSSIRYEVIEELCTLFQCTPSRLFAFDNGGVRQKL
ncbi:MAG: helix-turn-helix transcriptional regulator [Clostridia bacterium]|jgi:putative transcriptional regulator|nr:helix-turn-helix transcriptional regulator [Clostridia bacterium]MCI1959646.1 helix-turn-helix transcriptional regulator [Clostridia bacterium]MCI2000731.1 helix-turn-helix transcriptional regulator [Clostridia bacterium]MCI2015196.1 helix-turn-helix transcriptional regulator [Clostridia bacterium]